MKKLISFFVLLFLFFSCNQDYIETAQEASKSSITREVDDNIRDRVSNYDVLVQTTSKWLTAESARQWCSSLKVDRGHYLDEILLLEILCSDEADAFVSAYNQISGGSTTNGSLRQEITSSSEMLCIKIARYFEPYIENLEEFSPLITDFDVQNVFQDGISVNPKQILKQSGGDLIVHFVVTEATNTVLYNPSNQEFNLSLFHENCDEEEFYNSLANLAGPICSGEIPLSIAYDLQDLYIKLCTGLLVEICDNGIDDDLDGYIDCEDSDCCSDPDCGAVAEICNNGIDDDCDGFIDCVDPDCCVDPICGCLQEEICGNGLDDDGDGLIDGNDPDCFGGNSPCMRDHYLEDNFFYELELQSVQQLSGMGANACGGVISLVNPPATQTVGNYGTIYASFGSTILLEEWYDFLIKIHWGNPSGGTGQFQDLVYRFNIFELSNSPDFTYSIFSGGTSGTGGAAGAAILTINSQGLTETIPVSLGPILFYAISDVCGINNWDPGALGDKVAISIHEFDNCTLSTTTGQVNTNTTTKTYTSSLSLNYGLGKAALPVVGGVLFKNETEYATSKQNQVSSSYQTNYSNDYYLGQLNYSYCWLDQGTSPQVHEMPFGNIVYLRMSAEICD